jgi:hypothetical protein
MFRNPLLIGILYLFQNKGASSYIHKHILHTSILPFFPSIKLHDVVVISTLLNNSEVYTVDFSPMNQSPRGLISLFLEPLQDYTSAQFTCSEVLELQLGLM